MSIAWLLVSDRRDTQRCDCSPCVLAGCTRPPVHLKRTRRHPARWLHGDELVAFYMDEDATDARRHSIFERAEARVGREGPGRRKKIGGPCGPGSAAGRRTRKESLVLRSAIGVTGNGSFRTDI